MVTKKLMILALFATAMMRAAVTSNEVLLGVGTGFFARGASYALKKQSHATNQQAMIGAAIAAAVATVAVQGNSNGGGFNKGFAQIAIALATFVTSMYVFPTVNDEDDAVIAGNHYQKKCSGDCKHEH